MQGMDTLLKHNSERIATGEALRRITIVAALAFLTSKDCRIDHSAQHFTPPKHMLTAQT